MKRASFAWMILLSIWPLLTSCHAKPAKEEMTSVTVYGYNHQYAELAFSVRGGGSGVISARGQSGGICCLSVPRQWRPGIEVEVKWSRDLKRWDNRVVTVPEYESQNATSVNMHFLRGGEIKAIVTRYALGHPDYPLQGTEAELTPGTTPGAPWWRDPLPTDDKENKQ